MNLTCINKRRTLSILPLSILLSLYGTSVAHAANIIADAQAPIGQQAEIIVVEIPPDVCRAFTPGCVGMTETIVNIQAPDDNGLSHNKYSKFDVIANDHFDVTTLNNRLADESEGNPFLKEQTATVILNEVNSLQASTLHGKIRVGGQNAHVIIANPAGIDCQGCSFLNSSHVTLTTGIPSFQNNKLKGFTVEKGNISIEKGKYYSELKGLYYKANSTTYLDLFADTVTVNGELNADDVYMVTGQNEVGISSNGESLQVPAMADANDVSPVKVGLDVSEIGGMYANKIHIYATDSTIKNKGVIHTNGMVSLNSAIDIDNSDGEISGQEILLSSSGVMNNSNGTIMHNGEYELSPSQGIEINARGLNNESGKIEFKNGGIAIKTVNTIKNGKGVIKALSADGPVKIEMDSKNLNNIGGRVISSGSITGNVDNIKNNKGMIMALGGVELNEKTLINDSGRVISGL